MFGQHDTLLHELNREDPRCYKNFLCVDADLFQEFVRRVGPQITTKTTKCHVRLYIPRAWCKTGISVYIIYRHLYQFCTKHSALAHNILDPISLFVGLCQH